MMNAKTQTHAPMGITGRGLPFLPLVLLLLFGSCGNQAAYQYRPSSEELNLKAVSKIEKAWVARHHYDHERRLLVPKVGGVKWGAVQEYKEDGTLVFRDWWERDRKIEDLEAPEATTLGLVGYCGSVAVDPAGTLAAVSAPRGNRVLFWDTETRKLASTLPLTDGCGLAPGPKAGTFVLTSGSGAFMIDDPAGNDPKDPGHTGNAPWDNHLTAVPPSGAA